MFRYLIIIFFLSSCYTNQKATNDINKAIDKKPKIAAELFRKAFPCTNTDTIVKVNTAWDYVEFECPDKPIVTKTDTILLRKNVFQKQYIPGKTVVVAGKTEVKTITIKVKDSAEIYLLNTALKNSQSNEQKLIYKLENRNKLIWWLLIPLLISIFLHFIKNKK